MSLDVVIIADGGEDSLSATNSLKLKIQGRVANIQIVSNYVKNKGKIVAPVEGDNSMSWASAPKLNGIYLYSYLVRNNLSARLINSFYSEKEEFRKAIEEKPRAVVVSTTFIHSKKNLNKLILDIRTLAPEAFIIVGGPLVYFSYLLSQKNTDPAYDVTSPKGDYLFLEITEEPQVDLYIVSRRGEKTLCDVLNNLKDGRQPFKEPDTARLIDGQYQFSRQVDSHVGGDDFFIDWKQLPDFVFQSGVVPMQASIGCPHKCAFCNFVKDHQSTYIKPIDQLVDELKTVAARGVKYVWFSDDNFRLGSHDLNEVCKRLIAEELGLKWLSFIRASTLKKVDFELLRRSGCVEVQIGLESADAQVLKNMNKKADPDLYGQVIKGLLAAGINCSCYFIFGFPGETEQTAQRTRDFIKCIECPSSQGLLSWSIFPFMLSPLSPIYESQMKQQFGLDGYMLKWSHRTMDSLEAIEQVKKTFFALEDSGPIYRGDNQDMLLALSPVKGKRFIAARQALAKKALMEGSLEKESVLEAFSGLFE